MFYTGFQLSVFKHTDSFWDAYLGIYWRRIRNNWLPKTDAVTSGMEIFALTLFIFVIKILLFGVSLYM